MLEIKNVTVSVLDKLIIKDLDLTIQDGEIHAIMGPNGVGKSTICKSIMKSPNYEIKKGSIIYNGVSLNELDTNEIAQLGIYYISQNPIAIEGVTNAEMLRVALNARRKENINIFEFNKECTHICEKINLPKSFLHRSINDGMSGGERKKNELLHLWMLKPNLILLDELDSGLDVDALKIVASSIMEYYKELKPSILIITHHPQILDIIKPDYVHIIKDGKIIKSGDISLSKQIEEYGFSFIFETKELSENE